MSNPAINEGEVCDPPSFFSLRVSEQENFGLKALAMTTVQEYSALQKSGTQLMNFQNGFRVYGSDDQMIPRRSLFKAFPVANERREKKSSRVY